MKQLFKKPSYYLISSAMDGNEKAIEKLLAFYDPYISKCCLRSLYDEYGNVYIVVDMELKGRIRVQFTTPSGLHSVLERPFSEANGRPFLVKRSPLIVC